MPVWKQDLLAHSVLFFLTSQEAFKFKRLISSGTQWELEEEDDIRHADHSLVVKNSEDVELQCK